MKPTFIRNASARKPLHLIIAIVLISLLSNCAQVPSEPHAMPPFNPADAPLPPDYTTASGWLDLPEDPEQFEVDILWVYPTVLYNDPAWLMDTSRKDLTARAQRSVTTEARAFTGQANLYAPLYRQVNLAGFGVKDRDEREQLLSYGVGDVARALRYYFTHLNKGRPFILASHSQGSYALIQLILEHMGKYEFQNRFIAGYLIGWPITQADLKKNPAVKICAYARQTGCFISYNSVAPGKQKDAPFDLEGAISVNPLTWSLDTKLADASLNRGSSFATEGAQYESIPGFASAQNSKGGLAVVAKDPERLNGPFFPPGIYHSYDYALFFANIQSNVSQRIQAALAQAK